MVVNLVGDEKLENRTADATYIRKVAQDFHPLLDAELGTTNGTDGIVQGN